MSKLGIEVHTSVFCLHVYFKNSCPVFMCYDRIIKKVPVC